MRYPSRLQFPKDYQVELFPLHSPLLRESLLVSFPPLSYMLKFSGSSYVVSGQSVGGCAPGVARVGRGAGQPCDCPSPQRPGPAVGRPLARARSVWCGGVAVAGVLSLRARGCGAACVREHYHTALRRPPERGASRGAGARARVDAAVSVRTSSAQVVWTWALRHHGTPVGRVRGYDTETRMLHTKRHVRSKI